MAKRQHRTRTVARKGNKRSTQRRRAKQRISARIKRKGSEQASQLHDLEELMIRSLAESTEQSTHSRLLPHSIIYNSTNSLKELSYRHGFYVGKELYNRAGGGSVAALMRVLHKANLGGVLYNPLEDAVIIKTFTKAPHSINAGLNVHTYEAGLIAGYLSAHASAVISTRETDCIYNGSHICKFVSTPLNLGNLEEGHNNLGRTIRSMLESIKAEVPRTQKASHIYASLSMLPLTEQPLRNSVSSLFFIVGKELAASTESHDYKNTIRKVTNFLGLKCEKIIKTPGRLSIAVRYSDYNSSEGFVELTTRMLIGFLNRLFGSEVEIRMSTEKGGYAVNLAVRTGD